MGCGASRAEVATLQRRVTSLELALAAKEQECQRCKDLQEAGAPRQPHGAELPRTASVRQPAPEPQQVQLSMHPASEGNQEPENDVLAQPLQLQHAENAQGPASAVLSPPPDIVGDQQQQGRSSNVDACADIAGGTGPLALVSEAQAARVTQARGDTTCSPALGAMHIPAIGNTARNGPTLAQLPQEIRSIDAGMIPAIKDAPMRLLRVTQLLTWPALLVYEEVQPNDCMELPYRDVGDELWACTLVLSWRWGAPKPPQYRPGFSPMTPAQWAEFRKVLEQASSAGFEYAWVDWSCVPQYSADSMIEVMRSKVFYARAQLMAVLPTFAPLPDKGSLRVLLFQTASALQQRATGRATLAASLLEAIRACSQMAGHEYFGRVWTLAERMARYGRREGLCHWLPAQTWLGMVLSALLAAAAWPEDHSALQVYGKILGSEARQRLAEALEPLRRLLATDMVDDDVKAKVADVCELALDAWMPPSAAVPAATTAVSGAGGAVAAAPEGSVAMGRGAGGGSNGGGGSIGGASSDGDGGSSSGCDGGSSGGGESHGGSGAASRQRPRSRGSPRVTPSPAEPAPPHRPYGVLAEAPTRDWLRTYLGPEARAGVYEAWSQEDRVWAVYTYFCWRAVPERSHGALRAALEDLVDYLGGDPGTEIHSRGMFVQLGLEDSEDGQTPLHRACASNRVVVARDMLAAGADVDARDKAGCTPLLLACARGHKEVVAMLLSEGGDTGARDGLERTALMVASAAGHLPLVKELLAAHRGRSAAGGGIASVDSDGRSALFMAAENGHAEVVDALLQAGADKDALAGTSSGSKSDDRGHYSGWTPLVAASAGGHAAAVEVLLQAGAQGLRKALLHASTDAVRARLSERRREAFFAAAIPTAGALAHGGQQQQQQQQPLVLSNRRHSGLLRDIHRSLQGSGAMDLDDLLLRACREGCCEVICGLLAAGAAIDARDSDFNPPLVVAAQAGHAAVVSLLLDEGASLLALARRKSAHAGCYTDDVRAVLLERRLSACEAALRSEPQVAGDVADAIKTMLLEGDDDDTGLGELLDRACEGRDFALVRGVVAAGADVDRFDGKGLTQLMKASGGGDAELVEVLLEVGAKAGVTDSHERFALLEAARKGHVVVVRMLLAAGADVDDDTDHDQRTALMHASERGKVEVVRELLAAGANVKAQDHRGRTALMFACCADVGRSRALAVVQKLLAAGADVKAQDHEGQTALMLACRAKVQQRSALAVVQKLLAAGAERSVTDRKGRTAADCAVYAEVAAALR